MIGTLTEEEAVDFQEGVYDLFETYLDANMLLWKRVSFIRDMKEDILHYILAEGIAEGWCSDEDRYDLEDYIEDVAEEVLSFLPKRQGGGTNLSANEINALLIHLDKFPKQVQRSPEWYFARQKLFSASNLWKLFGSVAQRKNLLVEKILPPQRIDFQSENVPGPLQWGIKYEPVSVLIYEHIYATKVNTAYGCIPHRDCPIGASPDGINNDPTSSKFGYMLEVKNIYNREMNGIPSEEYWVQIQIQLETCQLQICDFVETRIKEYSEESFIADTDREYKGMVLFLIPRDSTHTSKYCYCPLSMRGSEQLWKEEVEITEKDHIIYHVDYWYLDEFYCTAVERNQAWFAAAKPLIEAGWQEVIEGRNHEEILASSSLQMSLQKSKSFKNAVCLIKLPSEEEWNESDSEEFESDDTEYLEIN